MATPPDGMTVEQQQWLNEHIRQMNMQAMANYAAQQNTYNVGQFYGLHPVGSYGALPLVYQEKDEELALLRRVLAVTQQRLAEAEQENDQLRLHVKQLRDTLESWRHVSPSTPTTLGAALKRLIALAHPDKWPDNPLAHEITVALNKLREGLG